VGRCDVPFYSVMCSVCSVLGVLSAPIRGRPPPVPAGLHVGDRCHFANLRSQSRDRVLATSVERSPGRDDRPDKLADPKAPWPYQLRRVTSRVRRAMNNTDGQTHCGLPRARLLSGGFSQSPTGTAAGQRQGLVTFHRKRIVLCPCSTHCSTPGAFVSLDIGSGHVADHTRPPDPMGIPGRGWHRYLDGR
jgi:hypothetical protein